jgi:hypothetical protein
MNGKTNAKTRLKENKTQINHGGPTGQCSTVKKSII